MGPRGGSHREAVVELRSNRCVKGPTDRLHLDSTEFGLLAEARVDFVQSCPVDAGREVAGIVEGRDQSFAPSADRLDARMFDRPRFSQGSRLVAMRLNDSTLEYGSVTLAAALH